MQRKAASLHLEVTWRDESFRLEKSAAGWVVLIGDGRYLIGPDPEPYRFFRDRLRNTPRRAPIFIASPRYPLLLSIDRVPVRAHPQMVARGTGAPTFRHPVANRIVGTERGPVWIFAAGGLTGECGTATPEQTVADVVDLATVWLRSSAP